MQSRAAAAIREPNCPRLAHALRRAHSTARPASLSRGWCTGLNVVPLTPPPLISFPDEQNIPWGLNDCTRECFAGEPEGSSICYGLRETSLRTVEAPWDIIQDDPRDEVFYSTCFRKEAGSHGRDQLGIFRVQSCPGHVHDMSGTCL